MNTHLSDIVSEAPFLRFLSAGRIGFGVEIDPWPVLPASRHASQVLEPEPEPTPFLLDLCLHCAFPILGR
jgi:hypothetical protein